MSLNKIIKIIISEPWDFRSSDGDNILLCKVVNNIKLNEKIVFVKVISTVIIDNELVEYLLLKKRNQNDYNIFKLSDYEEKEEFNFKYDSLEFVMIGKIITN